jgi:hypothetical protein
LKSIVKNGLLMKWQEQESNQVIHCQKLRR